MKIFKRTAREHMSLERFLFLQKFLADYIFYSNRAKYKGKKYFSSSSRNSKNVIFSRKFCRKTTVNVPSKIKFWIEKNAQLEKELWTLNRNPKIKVLIFEIKNINKIK